MGAEVLVGLRSVLSARGSDGSGRRVPPSRRPGRGRRRHDPLLVARRPRRLARLPRRRVGPTGGRRRPPVREGLPGGLPGRPVVADHPPQARGVPSRLRRLRPDGGGRVHRGRRRAVPRRRRHRPPPRQGRVDGQQRVPGIGGHRRVRVTGRLPVVVRAGRAYPLRRRTGWDPGQHPGVDGARPRPEAARLVVRGSDHRVRPDAGHGHGQRPPGGLCPPSGSRRRAGGPGAARPGGRRRGEPATAWTGWPGPAPRR